MLLNPRALLDYKNQRPSLLDATAIPDDLYWRKHFLQQRHPRGDRGEADVGRVLRLRDLPPRGVASAAQTAASHQRLRIRGRPPNRYTGRELEPDVIARSKRIFQKVSKMD